MRSRFEFTAAVGVIVGRLIAVGREGEDSFVSVVLAISMTDASEVISIVAAAGMEETGVEVKGILTFPCKEVLPDINCTLPQISPAPSKPITPMVKFFLVNNFDTAQNRKPITKMTSAPMARRFFQVGLIADGKVSAFCNLFSLLEFCGYNSAFAGDTGSVSMIFL